MSARYKQVSWIMWMSPFLVWIPLFIGFPCALTGFWLRTQLTPVPPRIAPTLFSAIASVIVSPPPIYTSELPEGVDLGEVRLGQQIDGSGNAVVDGGTTVVLP